MVYNVVCMDTVNNSNKLLYVVICVVYNVVSMATVSNSNKIWHVLICVVCIKKNSVYKSAGVPQKAVQWCRSSPLNYNIQRQHN